MDENKFLSRRNFIKLCGGAILLTGASAAASHFSLFEHAAKGAKKLAHPDSMEADYLRQIITTDSRNSRTIMWQSSEPQAAAAIEYREKGSEESQHIPALSESFTDDGVTCSLHTAELSGLQAGKAYEYRTTADKKAGSWHDLRAADEGSFQALIFPDSQSNDYSGWKELAQNAYERNPGAGFFVNMGDLVDNGEDHTQWNAWFDAVSGIIDRIPCAPLMGNHETYNQNWKVRLPEAWLHEFAVPQNGSTEFERYYYAFDYGPVHFTVLNTQWDELNEFKNGLLAEQISWLRKDLASTKKKWKIVLLHKDVLQYRIHNRPERKEGISDVGEVFMPIFDEFQVDVVFSAHLHTYRNRGHIQNFRASSQGPYYILTGVAGNVRYPGLWTDHALDRTVAPQPETDNYLTLDAAENSLLIRCFLPNGDKIDHVLLNK